MLLISARQIRSALTWESVIQALYEGHKGSKPQVQDVLLNEGAFTLLGRGVILPKLGAGMKIASIYPPNVKNPDPTSMEDAIFAVIDESSKKITSILDGPELTRWKTAADSALGSRLLSREDSDTLLVLGAGPISNALAEAHLHVRSSLSRVLLWNRTPGQHEELAKYIQTSGRAATIVSNLADAVGQADIITSATGTKTPLIIGKHLRPGCHIDLVGGYTPQMREADNLTVKRASVFVNNRATAIEHVGDICQPIAQGVILESAIRGDLFDLVQAPYRRRKDEITMYKNAGGAHLDLLVATEALSKVLKSN